MMVSRFAIAIVLVGGLPLSADSAPQIPTPDKTTVLILSSATAVSKSKSLAPFLNIPEIRAELKIDEAQWQRLKANLILPSEPLNAPAEDPWSLGPRFGRSLNRLSLARTQETELKVLGEDPSLADLTEDQRAGLVRISSQFFQFSQRWLDENRAPGTPAPLPPRFGVGPVGGARPFTEFTKKCTCGSGKPYAFCHALKEDPPPRRG